MGFNGGREMSNEEVIAMLDCIQNCVFCEDANRECEYCQNTNCTECQVDFCKRQLEEGKELAF